MRNLKKVLSTIMAVAMMMSLVVFNTSAAFNDQDKIVNTDAVNMNVALKIINGLPDGTFNPTGNVTRAEMAKMICILLNGGTKPAVGAKAGAATFSDIKGHWAEGYIESCAAMGIVAGMGDGTFAPNANVTATQAAKMLLVALGYDAAFEGFNGANWNVKINVAASQKNLYEDVTVASVNNPLSRDNAAQMVWNALNANEVKYTYSLTTVNGALQNVQVREDKTVSLLEDKYNTAADYEALMIGYSFDTDTKDYTYTMLEGYTSATATPPNAPITQNFKSKLDFTGLFGLNVSVVYKDTSAKTVYGMYAEDSVILGTGIVGDLDTSSATQIKFDGTKYDLDYTVADKDADTDKDAADALGSLPVYAVNVWTASDYATKTLANNKAFEARLIDSDDDGDVNYLVYAPFTVSKITYLGSTTLTGNNGLGSPDLEDINYYTGIAKNDYVKETAAANTADNTVTLTKVDKMVDGKVTRISGSSYYIDGTSYKLANGVTAPDLGDTVKDAVVVNGYIFALDASGTTSVEDYAIVVGTEPATGVNGAQAKLLFSDGTKKVVDTDTSYTAIANGTMVTFSLNSDKEYELTVVDFNTHTGTGFDAHATADVNGVTGAGTSTKASYVAGWNIADDAVIFVCNNNNTPADLTDDTFKTITGAQLKNTSISNLDLVGAFGVENTSNGFYTVSVAYITSTLALTNADTLYAYAVADGALVKNADNESVYEYTLWNGTKDITLLAIDDTIDFAVAEGDVVAYTLNSDGEVDDIDVYTSADADAITAYDGTYIQLNGASTRYEIDADDTVILYIDNDASKGVAGGSIALADKPSSYVDNAIVLHSATDVDLIVFDVDNDYAN